MADTGPPMPERPDGVRDSTTRRSTGRLRALVIDCVRWRWGVILLTVAIFVGALFVFARFVPQQFFPDSTRPELLVDLRLAEGAFAPRHRGRGASGWRRPSAGQEGHRELRGLGDQRPALPCRSTSSSRTNFAQFVILTAGLAERRALRAKLIHLFGDEPRPRADRRRTGERPPVGFPVQFRVSSGPDLAELRRAGGGRAMRRQSAFSNVHMDWVEPSKVVRVASTGTRRACSASRRRTSPVCSPTRCRHPPVNPVPRGATPDHRAGAAGVRRARRLSQLPTSPLPVGGGRNVPLAQVAPQATSEPG